MFILRHVASGRKLCQQLTLDALEKAVPRAAIEQALQETQVQTQRERKLNLTGMVLLVIAMNLYANDAIGFVWHKLCRGLRLLQNDPEDLPGDSALVYRRYQLRVRPMAALFRRLCRPLATQDTPDAFLFGLRLVSLDGQEIDVPDTAENVRYFGKRRGSRGDSAFPKARILYLCECGTHAIFDAGIWPCTGDEKTVASRLLRSVHEAMLLLFDRGLWSFERIKAVRQRCAHVLCRLPAHVKPGRERPLRDGSWLVWIASNEDRRHGARHKDSERLLVRLIEYTICEPNLPDHGQHYRLITTLLDPDTYPAGELAIAYHERWEIENTLDEVETHQHLHDGPLRSKKPVGVLQELYGLLIAHWALRFLMHEAALKAGVDPERLSFTHALRLVGEAIRDFALAAPECYHWLYVRLLEDMASRPLPKRRARSNPRVVKRKMSNFDLKREEHKNLPKPKLNFQEAIVLI